MDTRTTEEGTYSVHNNTIIMEPEIRLICPKLVPEWQDKGQLFYTDSLKTDSFYFNGIQRCYYFSEYQIVSKDSLSIENSKLLGFEPKRYKILRKDGRTVLKSLDNKYYILTQARTTSSL
jgi:hypothetical protein